VSTANTIMLTFSVENRMFGVDRLAKQLNALVNSGRIHDWHPGRWDDWTHRAIEIGFDSVADAQVADLTCHDAASQMPPTASEENNIKADQVPPTGTIHCAE
jgi:hypothetical protein